MRGFVAGSGGDVLSILLGASDSDGLNGTGVDSVSELLALAEQRGEDAYFDLGGGNEVTLVGVSVDGLSSANFELIHADSF